MIDQFNESYWTERYKKQETGWDIGDVSTPLKAYFDQLTDLNLKILIPGAGNAYEAEYLWNLGFRNTYVIDLSSAPLDNLKSRIPDFPSHQLIKGDFFDHTEQYDLIVEQTFFCALNPELREAYVHKVHGLLKLKGKLVGLLFKIPLNSSHPPFGGNEEQYRPIFKGHFEIEIMEEAYNSIPPRQGSELFIKLVKSPA